MTTETNAERLERVAKEVRNGWSNSKDVWTYDAEDMMFLVEQAERAQKSETIIRRLYSYLGSSAELDFKLWKETEAYVKSLSGETNGQRKA